MSGTKKFWKSLLRNLGKSEELSENIIIHQLDKERQGFLHFVVAVYSLSAIQLFVIPWKRAKLPCRLPSPGVCSNSCPLSQWCHPTISFSVIPFSSCLQSFPVSGSFPVSQFFASGGRSIGVSASASVLPVNMQDWFPIGLTCLISLQSKILSRVFSKTKVQKHQFFGAQLSLWSNSLIHRWLLEKP